MFDVAGGVRLPGRRRTATWLQRSVERSPFDFASATAGKQGRLIGDSRPSTNAIAAIALLYVIHV
jgi:hypothetical protein